MNRFRSLFFYSITIGIFSFFIYVVLSKGMMLQHFKEIKSITLAPAATSSWQLFVVDCIKSIQHPLPTLLLQVIVIVCVARLMGFLFRKIGQPSVIGEIIAGIMLGPSLFGHLLPQVSAVIFPAKSLDNLQLLSQIGLILFMFVVGMELNPNTLKNKIKDAVVISHASIIFPFALGIFLAFFIYQEFAPPQIGFIPFALFTGISMSITAFPVLARIVQERGLSHTKLGSIAITCAATDDITAWFILAVVIAIVKATSTMNAVYTMLLTAAYLFLMLKVIRPLLKRFAEKHSNNNHLSKSAVALFFITLIVSAYVTEAIGIHALFGAFMAGVIMPLHTNFRSILIEKVEDVALVLLLPLFFVFTGLRTQVGLLDTPHLWTICCLVILVAVAGKFGGSTIAAKFVGQSWKESLSVGALMNTRGLMELVVLNIGYDLGILSPKIFAMMVIMALVTTFMTGPALDLINKVFKEEEA